MSQPIDKARLIDLIISQLETNRQTAADAADQARDTATHGESVAKSKYETFGLEASYLAHGQSQRVAEYDEALQAYRNLNCQHRSEDQPIALGSLIEIAELDNQQELSSGQWLFLGPGGGGVQIEYADNTTTYTVTLITVQSPLGQALPGLYCGDDFSLMIDGQKKEYEVITAI